ncbi:LacI family DNA-binding transcriptional regulator [Sphaerisporangium dianthi]|uniref:LacI family DNA-binding transcriptional regulator n=1 Tax=Sphaerisporangium dianthi TaxID=1436120 RepID=A0ABV9CVR7_9ACTN
MGADHRPDVAGSAGVSQKMVSCVLNPHSNVHDETRARGIDAIEWLGRRRNTAVRAYRSALPNRGSHRFRRHAVRPAGTSRAEIATCRAPSP